MVVSEKKIAAKWLSTYARAKAYFNEKGNLDVPARYVDPVTGTKLGAWLANQRYARRDDCKTQTISAQQIQMLDTIGMNWGREDGNKGAWEEYIRRIQEYRDAYGNCRVPKSYVDPRDGYQLGKLVSNIRSYNRGVSGRTVPLEYKKRLDDMGFDWGKSSAEIQKDNWEKGYSALEDYLASGGRQDDITATLVWKDFKLGSWLYTQMSSFQGAGSYAPLEPKKYEKLKALGIDLTVRRPMVVLTMHYLSDPRAIKPPLEHPVMVLLYMADPCWREGVRITDRKWLVGGQAISSKKIEAWAEFPQRP